ncbi:hypothetical protein DIZ27_44960 [Streptomyces sp. NWU339]|nr:hypothetical protein DIZ27_44960 [Streptomyces sp. NWU339]
MPCSTSRTAGEAHFCPAGLIPDATGFDAFDAAYNQAKQQRTVFVAIELLSSGADPALRLLVRGGVCAGAG